MTDQPRARYALPWPPDADPPAPESTPTLWLGTCPVCSGSGVVALSAFGLDGPAGADEITCRDCGGSGIAAGAETERRRLWPGG